MASLNFDVASHQTVSNTLPAGQYVLEAFSSELKQTKAGTGSYINMGFKVLQGPQAGRTFYQLFNIHNPNEIAQQIGRDALKKLTLAVGKHNVNDTTELHGVPFLGTVKVVDGGDYDDKNEIKKYDVIAGQASGMVGNAKAQTNAPSIPNAAAQNHTASPSNDDVNTPSWKRA